MKYIVLFIKKIVFAICMLYAINLIVSSAGIHVPINYITIGAVSVLGLPALIGLVVMQKLL